MPYQDPITEERQIELATDPPNEVEKQIELYKEYYGGDQHVELSARQKEYLLEMLGLPDSFANVCKMVISVINDRLKIRGNGEGVRPFDETSTEFSKVASDWWILAGLDAVQAEVHRNTLRDNLSAVMVEWDQINNIPVITPAQVWSGTDFESSVRFFTDGDDNIIFAAKEWIYADYSEDVVQTQVRLNIYRPGVQFINEDGDEVIVNSTVTRYLYDIGASGGSVRALTPSEVAIETRGAVQENPQILPLFDIPIIRFENFPSESEIAEVIRFQDLINHSLATLDTGIDFHGFPIFTAEEFINVNEQEIGPGSMLTGNKINRIEPPNLEAMWKGTVLEQLRLLAIVKRWPVWVLLTDNSGNAPSGEALRRQERPLVSQIEEKQAHFSLYWTKVFDYAKELHNFYNPTKELDGRLVFQWIDPSTTNAVEQRQLQVQTAKEAGISTRTIWERIFGMTDEQIDQEFNRLQEEREMGFLDFQEPANPDNQNIQNENFETAPAQQSDSTNNQGGM